MHLLSWVALTRSLNPTVVEPTKIKHNNYLLLVGSEVSGAGLGRADYGLIPHNCNWVNKGLPIFVPEPRVKRIRVTNRLPYYECVEITGLM